jgi:hypothetical protein
MSDREKTLGRIAELVLRRRRVVVALRVEPVQA